MVAATAAVVAMEVVAAADEAAAVVAVGAEAEAVVAAGAHFSLIESVPGIKHFFLSKFSIVESVNSKSENFKLFSNFLLH